MSVVVRKIYVKTPDRLSTAMFCIRGTRVDRQRYLPKTSGVLRRSLTVPGKGPSLQTMVDYSVSAIHMKCLASKINARQTYRFAQYESVGARER